MNKKFISLVIISSLISVICTGCKLSSCNATVLIDKYNQFCDAEYTEGCYNTAFEATTLNKESHNTAIYIREIDSKGNIHLSISGNNCKGDAYYIVDEDKPVCYLDLGDGKIRKATDIDVNYFMSVPLINKFTLDKLGFKGTDDCSFHVEDTTSAVYTFNSNELGELKLKVDGTTDTVKQIVIDGDSELFTMDLYEPENINISINDTTKVEVVDKEVFAAELMHLKLNGYIADGVYEMDNANTFSIDATIVNPEDMKK